MGTVGKQRSQRHWASKCKPDCTLEFEQRGIPFQLPDAQHQRQHELDKLGGLFNMSPDEVHKAGLVQNVTTAALAFTEAGLARRSRAQTLTETSEAEEVAQGVALKCAQKWRARATVNVTFVNTAREECSSEYSTEPLTPSSPGTASASGITWARQISTASAPASGTASTPLSSRQLQPLSPLSPPLSPRAGPTRKSLASRGASIVATPRDYDGAASSRGATPKMAKPRASLWDAKPTVSLWDSEGLRDPVSPREMREASIPTPIAVAPLFQRAVERPKKDSHYDFFNKANPNECPNHRQAKQSEAETQRKLYLRQLPDCVTSTASSTYGSEGTSGGPYPSSRRRMRQSDGMFQSEASDGF